MGSGEPVSTTSKLRWEGSPSFAHEARDVLVASALWVAFLGLVPLLSCAVSRDPQAPFLWPIPVTGAIAALLGLSAFFWLRKNTRVRVTTSGVEVATPLGQKRYLIPHDSAVRASALQGGSLHVGEVPCEERGRKGELVWRGTEPLTLAGLGAERSLVERALAEARSDELFAPFAPRLLPDASLRELVSGREPQDLLVFRAGLPASVPGAVARAVRGVVARACDLPVDYVLARDVLDALPGFALCDAPSLYFALVGASGECLDFAALDLALIRRGATVSDLAVAVTSAVRRGARRSP
jgi:hypothetical protein